MVSGPAMTSLPAEVSVRLVESMRLVADAACKLAAEMPAVAAAMTEFVATMSARLPAAIAFDGPHEFDVAIWHDLLWYGYAKTVGVAASGFTRDDVLRDLRAQIVRTCDLPSPEAVMLRSVPG